MLPCGQSSGSVEVRKNRRLPWKFASLDRTRQARNKDLKNRSNSHLACVIWACSDRRGTAGVAASADPLRTVFRLEAGLERGVRAETNGAVRGERPHRFE